MVDLALKAIVIVYGRGCSLTSLIESIVNGKVHMVDCALPQYSCHSSQTLRGVSTVPAYDVSGSNLANIYSNCVSVKT